jgi:protein TonB
MSRAGAASFAVAAALHAVLLLAVPAGWWATRPAPRSPEAIRLELTLAAPVPAAPTVGTTLASPTRRSEPAPSARRSTPPREVVPSIAPESPHSSATRAPAPEERGAGTLSAARAGPGEGHGASTGAPAVSSIEDGYRVVSQPSYLTRVQPIYPPQALRLRQQGVVVLTLYISAEGRLDRVEVTKSSGHRALDEAAVAAEQESRFRPATLGGRPVPCKAEVPYRFELD